MVDTVWKESSSSIQCVVLLLHCSIVTSCFTYNITVRVHISALPENNHTWCLCVQYEEG